MNTLIRQNLPASLESICSESVDSSAYWIRKEFNLLLRLLQRYYAVAKQRRDLSQLTDEQLKDIGISRVDAMREASKPFWR
jgi:uncharacterized protein YjiS (DUF1127 family)